MSEEQVNNLFRKLTDTAKLLSDKETVGKMSATIMSARILPFISLADSGYSRGVFVGALESAGIRISPELFRDRRFVEKNDPQIDESEFSRGRQQGRGALKSGSEIRNIKITMSTKNYSQFSKIVKGEIDRAKQITLEELLKAVKK